MPRNSGRRPKAAPYLDWRIVLVSAIIAFCVTVAALGFVTSQPYVVVMTDDSGCLWQVSHGWYASRDQAIEAAWWTACEKLPIQSSRLHIESVTVVGE